MNELHKNKGIELPDTLWQFVWRYLKTRKIYTAGMAFVGIVWCICWIIQKASFRCYGKCNQQDSLKQVFHDQFSHRSL